MQSASVTVDLNILAENISRLRAEISTDTDIMFVVKSDAYGHGIGPVTARASAEGVRWFAVAYLEEALAARKAAPKARILVLGPICPEEVLPAVQNNITAVVVDAVHAETLDLAAKEAGVTLETHVKVDTGMGRLGLLEGCSAAEFERIFACSRLNITGICSHLAAVDLKRPWLQEKQHDQFRQAFTLAESMTGRRLMRHFCSSRGVQYYKDWDYDAVRPGILLYGYGCNDPNMRVQTRPFLQMTSRMMQVKDVPEAYPIGYYSSYRATRDTQIGVVASGYADGYLRSMSNRGEALVHGKRVPVVGRISMNWITLDLGPDSGCKAGDDVTLIGEQGPESIWADRLGRRAGTIAYEILTAIHPRIPRQYVGAV
ncbi:MAG: alanine racemase [Verrucomicrobia bacterium]|nr:alanine racemase [Verrucomicrobiota bacterium]